MTAEAGSGRSPASGGGPLAQLFVDGGSEWLVAPLEADTHVLWGDSGSSLRPRRPAGGDPGGWPVLRRASGPSGGECWTLIHTPGDALRVNGTALTTGIRVLSHRDELRLAGCAGRVFFSLERVASVDPFEGVEASRCPRCQQVIERGTPAVRCPQCGVWHHQSEELPCWTYGPTCALDDQPSELGGGLRWTPDGGERRA